MKKKNLAAVLLISLLLAGCTEESAETSVQTEESLKADEAIKADFQNAETEPAVLEAGDQQFKIFSYHDALAEYVILAKEQPESLNELYSKTVFEPFRRNAFTDGNGHEYMDLEIFNLPKNLLPMQSALEALADKRDEFQSAIEKSLTKSAELLPGGDKTVHIFPAASTNTQGITLNEEVMIVWVYPALAAEELEQTIAHEYFHLIDMEKGTFESSTAASTLLEATVMEGKAVAFASIVYPDADLSWLSNGDGKVSPSVRSTFMEQKDSYDWQVWMDFLNGNPAKEIPPFANYIVGHEIMQSFLQNHPDIQVSEWLEITAEEILQGSDYGE